MSQSRVTVERPDNLWATVDPLGEVLHFLHMSGVVYARSELTAPWGLELPPLPGCVIFHSLNTGPCWLEVDGAEPRLLPPGGFALVAHGKGHRIGSAPGTPAAKLFDLPYERISERYEILRYGGGGTPTDLICGAVRFDHPVAHRLMEALPRMICLETWSSPYTEWVQGALGLMALETRQPRPGGEAVVTRLADILVIQAIRSWIAEDPAAQTGWLGALRDKQIGHAISLLHRDPARAWTVASLAAEVGMSRSAFAARFRHLVGESVMRYVTRWRMHVALSWLGEDDAPLAVLADRLGYQSEAAFNRVFKRHIGSTPGAVRKCGTGLIP